MHNENEHLTAARERLAQIHSENYGEAIATGCEALLAIATELNQLTEILNDIMVNGLPVNPSK